jgi:ABC-type lipoprotein export system ATPase subunit
VVAPDAGDAVRLGDLALGLEPAAAGAVHLLGHDWASIDPDDACVLRGRDTGRVFGGAAWMSNLDLDENLTLAARYHRTMDAPGAHASVQAAAAALGLPELPAGRPAWLSARILQIAQWARALHHAPRLLVLEDPLHHLPRESAEAFARALATARHEGAAVLWISPAEPDAAILPDAVVGHIHDGVWTIDPRLAHDAPEEPHGRVL